MNITVITTSYPRWEEDEAGIFVRRLVLALSRAGVKGTVLVPKDFNETLNKDGEFVIKRFEYLPFVKKKVTFGAGMIPNIKENFFLVFQLPLLYFGFIFKTVSAGRSTDLFLVNWAINGLAAYFAKKTTGKPYILVLRGRDMQMLKSKVIKFILSPVFKNASFIVSVNKGFMRKIKEDFSVSEEKLAVIENGISVYLPKKEELKEFLNKEGIKEGRYIVFVGSVVPRKGIELAIELISRINYTLVIAGRVGSKGYYHKLLERVKELNIKDRVVFKGAVSPLKVPFYLALSRYYISFSKFEGRPNALMEALAAKKVVIASDIEAHAEVVKDGDTGFLVSRDLKGVLKAKEVIDKLDSNNSEYLRISEAASKWASQFSWERTVEKYLAVFKKVLFGSLEKKEKIGYN